MSTPTPKTATIPDPDDNTDPVQKILHDLASPAFVVPVIIMAITFISVCVFCCVYNCCGKARTRRMYVEYSPPSAKGWIPEIHVPEQFRQARATEANVYRFER